MKTFKISPHYTVECWSENTRYGFRHLAVLKSNGYEIARTKACYYNRTWECYTFQSVGHAVIRKYFDKRKAKRYCDKMDGIKRENPLGTVAVLMKLGEIMGTTQAEKNKLQTMVVAAVPGIDIPADFANLPEEEKQRRLAGVAKIAGKELTKPQEGNDAK